MSEPTGIHRLPRARVDPIADPSTALALLHRILATPRRHETVLVLLDDEHRGRAIVSVDGTDRPDQVLDVIECVLRPELIESEVGAVIVASDRTAAGGIESGDTDRWFEMCDLTERIGVELVEWFVFGAEISCPRDRLGVPARWRGPDAATA